MAKEYLDADSVQVLAGTLLPTYHPELIDAKIKYFFVTEHSMKGGRPVYGKAKKLSGAMQYLAGGIDFAIEIAMDLYNGLDEAQRKAVVDHLLEYCTGEEDEESGDMTWTMREPDVKEFASILSRHGAWNDTLIGLVQVAQRLHIEERVQEVVDQAAAEGVQTQN
jgi:preprotein translocase subunit Sss1